MHRILIPTSSRDSTSWQDALACAKKIANQLGKPTDVTLLVHTKQQIDDGTALASHIGDPESKTLRKSGSIKLPWGGAMQLRTLGKIGQSSNGNIVIAFFADDQMLEKVDDLLDAAGVIAVPDQERGANDWTSRWGAVVHGQKTKPPDQLIGDAVVEAALTFLFGTLDPAKGIGDPRDKGRVGETLKILRANDHALDPVSIRSWAIKQGWPSRNAKDLEKLAQKIQSLRARPILSNIHNWQDRYKSWLE